MYCTLTVAGHPSPVEPSLPFTVVFGWPGRQPHYRPRAIQYERTTLPQLNVNPFFCPQKLLR